MDVVTVLLGLPAEWEAALVLGYVFGVLAGARVVEALARLHFVRACRLAELGFEYVADQDHYRCPEGERLSLHVFHNESRVAVYRAPASRCNHCPRKSDCTPHDEGRHIYRPLAAWAETDLGRFHQCLSLLLFSVGVTLSLVSLFRWGGGAGTGWLLVALAISLWSMLRDLRRRITAAGAGQMS